MAKTKAAVAENEKATDQTTDGTGALNDEERAKAEAAAEPAIDYNALITKFVSDLGDTTDLKVEKTEERIGRQVAVKITNTKTEATETVPRQDLIVALFENNWHRRNITDLFEDDVPYQIIFAATKNMENVHHHKGKTASPGTGTKRGKSYKATIGGEEAEYSQAELIRGLVEGKVDGVEAMDRGAVSEYMKKTYDADISYGVIYQATKDMKLPDARKKGDGEAGEKAPKKDKKDKGPKKPKHEAGSSEATSAALHAEANKNTAAVDDLEDNGSDDLFPADPADDSEDNVAE